MVDSVASSEPRCKCCLNENGLRDMWAGYISSDTGEFEIFGQMLTDCYNLPWDPPEDESPQEQICDSCVDRLRIAYNFKKEILETNELLTEVGKHATIKTESAMDSIDEGSLAGEDNETMQTEEPEYYDEEWLAENLHLNMKHEPDTEQYEEVEYLEEDASNIGSSVASDDQKYESDRPKKKKKKNSRRYKPYTEVEMQKALTAIQNKTLTITKASNLYDIPQNTLRQRIGTDEKGSLNGTSIKSDERVLSRDRRHTALTLIRHSKLLPFRWNNDMFICFYCQKNCRTILDLTTHTKSSHDNPDYDIIQKGAKKLLYSDFIKVNIVDLSCRVCDDVMKTFDDLKRHLNDKHRIIIDDDSGILPFKLEKLGVYPCAICNHTFPDYNKLNIHMNEHFKRYFCPQCGAGFLSQNRLKRHSIVHCTDSYPCSECNLVFKHPSIRRSHYTSVHKKAKRWKCQQCNEGFSSCSQKQNHMAKNHGNIKRFTCELCSKAFFLESQLKVHVNSIHLKLQRLNCKFCGEHVDRNQWQNHMKTHGKVSQFVCNICSKTFSRRAYMTTHVKTKHADHDNVCDVCGCCFLQKISLQVHKTRHLLPQH